MSTREEGVGRVEAAAGISGLEDVWKEWPGMIVVSINNADLK